MPVYIVMNACFYGYVSLSPFDNKSVISFKKDKLMSTDTFSLLLPAWEKRVADSKESFKGQGDCAIDTSHETDLSHWDQHR